MGGGGVGSGEKVFGARVRVSQYCRWSLRLVWQNDLK